MKSQETLPIDPNAPLGVALQPVVGGIPTSHPERENFFRKARTCCVCGFVKKTFAISKEFGAVCSAACLLKHNASNVRMSEGADK